MFLDSVSLFKTISFSPFPVYLLLPSFSHHPSYIFFSLLFYLLLSSLSLSPSISFFTTTRGVVQYWGHVYLLCGEELLAGIFRRHIQCLHIQGPLCLEQGCWWEAEHTQRVVKHCRANIFCKVALPQFIRTAAWSTKSLRFPLCCQQLAGQNNFVTILMSYSGIHSLKLYSLPKYLLSILSKSAATLLISNETSYN